MTPTLPFSDFLDALREKQFGVSLHEYLAVGKLLAHWDGADRNELRNSLAALIARHDEEVDAIRRLFDDCYPPPRAEAGARGAGAGATDTRERPASFVRVVGSPWFWAAMLVVLVAAAAVSTGLRTLVNQPLPAVARALSLPPAAGPLPVPASELNAPLTSQYAQVLVPPPAPPLPVPDVRFDWRGLALLGGSALALTFFPLWGVRLRASARRWTAAAWDTALASLPGPFHGSLLLKDLVTHMPRADVEEAATIMGRALARDGRSRRFDAVKSLTATVRAGMVPHLVYRPRRSLDPILVLRDISQPMAIHDARVEALISDLRRQGIALEVWYFDGDPARPSPRPRAPGIPLDTILRRRQDGPIMAISAGHGIAAALTGADSSWIAAIRQQTRRVWINPIVDPKLWPAQLQHLPITVVPMTRSGLLQAARLVTQDDRSLAGSLSRLSERTPTVTRAHVDRLKQLASLVPYPTVDLLELLRQRFAADIPAAAVLYAVDRQAALTNRPFRMSDDEIRTRLAELRAATPSLEAPVRDYLLTVLTDSQPAPGSAAHLRWEASVALHNVHLADLGKTDGRAAADELQRLYHGPLWEEVRDMVSRQPSSGPASAAVQTAVGSTPGDRPPVFSASSAGGRVEPFRLRPPGWRTTIAAAGAAAVAMLIGSFAPSFRVQASHRTDAYQLEYIPAEGGAPDQLRVRIAPGSNAAIAAPGVVQLYQDADSSGAPIDLSSGTAIVPIDAGASHIYQVRANLADGALALSNTVWAPSVLVLIDVLPWASITITSAQPGIAPITQVTPLSIRLPEGTYTIQVRNDDLNVSITEAVTVAANGQRRFVFTLPGYTPADVLRQLGINTAGRAAAK